VWERDTAGCEVLSILRHRPNSLCSAFGASSSGWVGDKKNTGLAAVLALILGILGLWGVGHIYVGKIGRGLALLILGIILEWVFGFLIFFGAIFGGYYYGARGLVAVSLTGVVIWIILTLAIFIWQIYDAYRLAKYYNEYVQRYGRAPW